MNSPKKLFRYIVVYASVIALTGLYPLQVYAEEAAPTTPASATTTPTPTPTPSTTSTPIEKPPQPKNTYTYDSATKRWNTNEWVYDAASNSYKPVVVSSIPAAPPAVEPQQDAVSAQQSQPNTDGTSATSDATKSTSESTTTNTSISNALDSIAKTGDASVLSNTLAGSAATGNASATATVINNVNSIVTNANNTEAATFVSDVMGDVNGDIMLQPMLLKAMLEANVTTQSNTVVNNNLNITNTLDLDAETGNALVAKNTSAGNATSGSAHTVADVMNIMNSMIASNQSFMGTINIYGNLNGDILIAPDFIPQMLANNSAETTSNSATTVVSNDTQSIVNNVSLAAQTGQAVVANNTKAGNATTGNADTNLVIFNLSGHEIVASNSLLVFVNVLGKWVGVIVDAPTGATAAAIGNGVTTNRTTDPSLTIHANNNVAITNNLDLSSKSGSASVLSNTLAGNATSGNATASANILNMTNSQLALSGWYGVLFINVYGSWTGSFGIDTAAGTIVKADQEDTQSSPPQVIRFVPRASSAKPITTVAPSFGTTTNAAAVKTASYTTYQTTSPQSVLGTSVTSASPSQPTHQRNTAAIIGSFVLILVSALVLRKILFA